MERLDCSSFQVCFGQAEAVLQELPSAEYVIAKVDRLRTPVIKDLQASGFVFHERFIEMKFNIKRALQQLPIESASKVTVQERHGFTEEMLALARKAYGTERRFHLAPDFDDALAAKVIAATASQYEAQGARVFTATHAGDLLGFCTFLPCGNDYYNAMGLTAPGIKGKMAALPLYTGATRMLEMGGTSVE